MRSSEWGAYSYFSFLTEDTLVIPNLIQNTLEIVRIAVDGGYDDDPRLVTLCTLGLPPLVEHASIVRLACRAEPNPIGSAPPSVPPPSSRPFRDKAADAIILFNLLIEDAGPHAGQFHFPETRPFTFIVHRRALVALIPPAQRACAPFCSAPGGRAHTGAVVRVGRPRDALVRIRSRLDALDHDDLRSARGHDGGAYANTHHSARL